MIADYEAVVPGMAEKIVTAFEEQGRHRRTLEDLSIREQWRLAGRGQVFAFTLGLVALGFAGTAILFGREVSGLIGVVVSLGTLLTVFLVGKRGQNRELREKDPEN